MQPLKKHGNTKYSYELNNDDLDYNEEGEVKVVTLGVCVMKKKLGKFVNLRKLTYVENFRVTKSYLQRDSDFRIL